MDKKMLLKLVGNTLTADAVREAGLTLVPVTPKGELPSEVLKAYINDGQPQTRFYQGHRLVTPETWESMRRASPAPTRFDPISGEPESAATSQAWDALAPIRLVDGTSVSAADLAAYAKATGRVSAEFTSIILRMVLPKGSEPVPAPEALEEAALEWPYDPSAASVAQRRRSGVSHRYEPPPPVSVPAQVVVNHGSVGAQVNVTGPGRRSRESQVADFLCSAFSVDELRRLLRDLPEGRAIVDALPSGGVSQRAYANSAAETLTRRNCVDRAFFEALTLARPRMFVEISDLRALYGL